MAFASAAGNLDPAANDGLVDVFLYDLASGITSLQSGGAPVGGDCSEPALADDGSALAFQCGGDVFLRSLPGGALQRLTTDDGTGGSFAPDVAPGGACVAFASEPPEPGARRHGYERARATSTCGAVPPA